MPVDQQQGRAGRRIVVLAPNWLGDVVMALPAIADVRRASPDAHLAVAARESVAGVLPFVPGVDSVLTLAADAGIGRQARALAQGRFDTAVLLPNSFRSAWLARRAGIRERWGYAGDGRALLLTRRVSKPTASLHQAEYYQQLTRALGMPPGPRQPRLEIPEATRERAMALLASRGMAAAAGTAGVWAGTGAGPRTTDAATVGRDPVVVLAPGAAYGTAKQWIPGHVAALISELTTAHGAWCVLVGSKGDMPAGEEIRSALDPGGSARVVDLIGRTGLEELLGVLAVADVCVSNDSGAMHLAAAIGTPVVGIFGPTNEHETSPVPRTPDAAIVLTHQVWCRPCMLRECPIDHGCMTGITPSRVQDAVLRVLNRAG